MPADGSSGSRRDSICIPAFRMRDWRHIMKFPSFSVRGGVPACLFLPAVLAAQSAWTPATREAVPEILSSGLTAGGFRLEIAAPPGDYGFARSTTLLENSWQNLGTINPLLGTGEATDPGALALPKAFYRVGGGFQETRMQLIAFDSTLVDSSLNDPGDPLEWGGMRTRQTRQNLLFQTAQPTSGLIRLLDGESGGFLVERKINPQISTQVSKLNVPKTYPVTVSGAGWNIAVDGGLDLIPVESGDQSFMGIHRLVGDPTLGDDGTTTSTKRSLKSLWMIAKSENAQPADLAGNWGFVTIFSDGYVTDGLLDGLAFPTSITAGPNPRSFTVNSVTGFEIEHEWGVIPAGVDSDFFTVTPNVNISLDLATDGGVTLTFPDGNPFRGMVSPSARLMVAASSIPDIVSDPDNVGLGFGEVQWLVGVKRATTPVLAGKTYRILRHGWWVEGDFFEVDRSGETDQLMFNVGGTSVTRSSEFIYDAVSFAGGFSSGSDADEFEMTVSIDPQGRILMEEIVPDDFTVRTFGFAREGSGLLVLVDSIELADGTAAGIGLMIAIEEP